MLKEILQYNAFIKKLKNWSSIYLEPGEPSLHLFIQR